MEEVLPVIMMVDPKEIRAMEEHENSLINEYDCVIVGASISGGVASYLLGKAGLRVLTIDPSPFPRRKPCGEGLSSLGVSCLTSLGLWGGELEQQAVPLQGFSIHYSDDKAVNILDDKPRVYGVSRAFLDAAIQQRCAPYPNVQFVRERVVSVDYSPEPSYASSSIHSKPPWTIHLESPPLVFGEEGDNKLNTSLVTGPRSIRSRAVILANGMSGASALLKNASQLPDSTSNRFGLVLWAKGHWENMPTVVSILNGPEGQYIITPIGKDEVNLSLLLTKERSRHFDKAKSLSLMLAFLQQQGFHVTESSDVLGVARIDGLRPRYHLKSHPPAFLIGDSIERFDPIGGLGMTHAVYSAAVAVREIVTANNSGRVPSVVSYSIRRNVGAILLRVLTFLSFTLNVRRTRFLVAAVSKFPRLAVVVTNILEGAFTMILPLFFPQAEKIRSKSSVMRQVSVFTALWRGTK